jgi:hypothetical protein
MLFPTTGSPKGLRGLPGWTLANDPMNLIRVMPAEGVVVLRLRDVNPLPDGSGAMEINL